MRLAVVLPNACVWITLLAVAGLVACGDADTQQQAREETAQEEESGTAPLPSGHPPITGAKPTPDPVIDPAPDPASGEGDAVARGREHYQLYCASCHGAGGAGDGPVAAGLDPKPAAHNDGNYMNGLSDEHLTKVIEEGGVSVGKSPLMAPWGGTLDDAQVQDVIAFIRSLADPPYPGS